MHIPILTLEGVLDFLYWVQSIKDPQDLEKSLLPSILTYLEFLHRQEVPEHFLNCFPGIQETS